MFLLFILAACTEPGDTGPADVPPLEPPADGTTFQYRIADTSGSLHWPAAIGDGEYEGEPYTEITLGDFSVAQPEGIRAWMTMGTDDPTSARIKTIEVWSGNMDTPLLQYLFEPAFLFTFDPSLVDEPQAAEPTGQFVLSGVSEPMDISGTYTLSSTDEDVDVFYDRIEGCWIYDFDLLERGFQFEAQIALKSRMGVVKSEGLLGFSSIELEEIERP